MVVQEQGVYQQAGFDYGELDPDVRDRTIAAEQRIREYEEEFSRMTWAIARRIGEELIGRRDELGNRKFKPWVEARTNLSIRQAYRLIDIVNNLPINAKLALIGPSALYALASVNTPEEVRKGFIDVAEAGHPVRNRDVQEAIAEHRSAEEREAFLETQFVCDECGELFSVEVWHCENCDHHWSEGDDTCKNCYAPRDGGIPLDEDDDDDAPDPASFEWSPGRPAGTYEGYDAAENAKFKNVHVSNNSGENEWYTPAQYIQAARDVMGGIDLDPASSLIANETVQATTFYAKDDNGLAQKWHGRVWMNPPYAQPLIVHFCEKLAEHVESGDVAEAISLVNNATDTRWFQRLAAASDAVCFPKGRIRFLDPEGNPGAPLQGQAILYCGPRRDDFERAFVSFGVVL